jgi:hypothetical protein
MEGMTTLTNASEMLTISIYKLIFDVVSEGSVEMFASDEALN